MVMMDDMDIIGNYSFYTGGTASSAKTEPLTKEKVLEAIKAIEGKGLVPIPPKFVEQPWPMVQVKTHKKNRTNKKWLKRYGTKPDYSVDDGKVFVLDTSYPFCTTKTVVAYPDTYRRLRFLIEERGRYDNSK